MCDRILSPKGLESRDRREENIEELDLFNVYKKHKNYFEKWLFENKSQSYTEQIIKSNNELFKENISISNLKKLISESKYSLKYTIIGFRNFLNYCEEFEIIDLNSINKLKSKAKLNFKSNIDNFVPNHKEIKDSLKLVKNKNKDFFILYKLMLESGIRFTELKHFIINFNKKYLEFPSDNIVIYNNFYIRGHKSSFYIFFSKKTFNLLENNLEKYNSNFINSFKNYINKNKDIISLKYLRKYQFTKMIENNISYEIANFIQGRSSQNIGFNHYLAKKEVAVKEYKKFIDFLF